MPSAVTNGHRTRIKVCCIQSVAEAELAVAFGADALGFVAVESSRRRVDDESIAAIVATVPPPVATFLLTGDTDADAIIDRARRVRPTSVQLADEAAVPAHAAVRGALAGTTIVQVIHVEDDTAIGRACVAARTADALLLDSGRPSLSVPELGGTGRVHDWSISRRIVEAVAVPVFVAGGLDPTNAAEAIRVVRPFGLDLCSGLRPTGALDARLLADFAAAVRRADAT